MLKSVFFRQNWWRGHLGTSRTISANIKRIKDDEIPLERISISSSRTESDSNQWRFNFKVFIKGAVFGSVTAISLWALNSVKFSSLEAAEVIEPSDNGDKSKKGPSRRDRFNFVAEVVTETGASLVYIKIKDRGFRDYYTGEATTVSNGSGFIVGQDGLILTNAHVVEGRPRAMIEIQLQDGRTFPGRVEDLDKLSDLATVRIDCKNLPVIRLGNSSDIRPGEFVVALGSPLALSNTITTGVVSTVARDQKELGIRGRNVPEYIQTDATITFGNSGGPLINLDGEAIGVNSMKITPGISFAIPIDYAKEFLRKCQQRREGKLPEVKKRRFMGIKMIAITPQIKEELRLRMKLPGDIHHGIVVYRVVRESPADNAGIQPGDVITHINGNEIHECSEVMELLETNAELVVTIRRENQHPFNVLIKPEY